jgi:alkylation response protein AidB-like acyl-CoA dehydrogenase
MHGAPAAEAAHRCLAPHSGERAEPAFEERATLDLLLPQVSRFLRANVDGYAIDRQGEIPLEVRAGLASLGLFGMTLPIEYGGAGLSLGAACRVVAEIARVDRSVAIMIGLHAGLGTRGLVERGAASLRARWLPRLASGESIASFGATEPGAGSALTAIRTTGRLVNGHIELEGEKSYVTNGGFAGLFTVLVRTPGLGGDRAHSLVCVPADTPGVRRGLEEDKLGIRGSSTVPVTFDRVRVPLDHVLGEPGRGLDYAHGLLAWGRTLMSAGCVGAARGALDATLEYVRQRRQFGSAIGDFAATRAHVAWMATRLHAMESLVRAVSAAQAAGKPIEAESTIAKVFCSEAAFEVCDRAVQLHGALGFLEPTGVARILRDTRITRIFEGANDVLLLRIGTAALGDPLVALADLAAGRWSLEDEASRVRELGTRIRAAASDLKQRHGVGAVRHQLALQRLARALVCVRAAQASICDGGTEDGVCARQAARALCEEGSEWLSRLEKADGDEADARDMTDRMYPQ